MKRITNIICILSMFLAGFALEHFDIYRNTGSLIIAILFFIIGFIVLFGMKDDYSNKQ